MLASSGRRAVLETRRGPTSLCECFAGITDVMDRCEAHCTLFAYSVSVVLFAESISVVLIQNSLCTLFLLAIEMLSVLSTTDAPFIAKPHFSIYLVRVGLCAEAALVLRSISQGFLAGRLDV